MCKCSADNHAIDILGPVRLNVKGLYSARLGRRSGSEDEEEDQVEVVPSGSNFSSNPPKMNVLGKNSMVSKK